MARRLRTLAAASLLLLLGVLAAGVGQSYSDGISGSSGAIEEHLRECQGVQYCKVKPAYCGGCHGSYDDMWRQEGAAQTPQEKVGRLTFKINGDAKGGTASGPWEYVPNGQTLALDIELANARPPGQYASGGFNLNASAGRLEKWESRDDTVRITGGMYQHAGTKNPSLPTFQGQKHGQTLSDETRSAGEATHTGKGSDVRAWRVRWVAPTATEEPRGVAFVMTAMLPDGDGVDDCTRRPVGDQPCAGDFTPQSEWDWFGFMVPRRIMCEKGAYASFADCQKAVLDFVLPPAPPVNTCGPDNPDCASEAPDEPGGRTVGPGGVGSLVLLGAAGAWARRRRDGNR